MRLSALTICRNEDWCLGCTGRALLAYCDEWIVLDHASTDRTPEIIHEIHEEHPGRVFYMRESNAVWREMEHRQRTLEAARARGATHLSVVDADELLCGDLLPTIRQSIEQLPPGAFMGIAMRNLHRSIHQYRSDGGIWGMGTGTMLAFADAAKLCWRAQAAGYQHHQRSPFNSRMGIRLGGMSGIMHLQFASWPRLLAKHALYKCRDRAYSNKSIAEIERLYSMAPNDAGAQVTPCPPEWWHPYAHLMRYLDVDAEPWQAAEAQRLMDEHGPEMFEGLNLFGVVECRPVSSATA